ncbi:MAG: PH domain-containing protein [Candidatus Nomurabacteria bacterium]|jgi:uncharacterized membrane protein YdbT with pleckstrin-like domain|nr:PH domain-containing protein [Candidatus Nomurabacteria bacterium]
MKQQFTGQRSDETVLFVFRRHIITMFKGIFGFIVLSGLGILPLLLVQNNPNLYYVAAIAILLGILVLVYHWIGWYFTVYIVTNQRIRQNIQKGLFSRSVVDLGLDKVQSAHVSIKGLWGSLLGYGVIILHTQAGDLVINKVSQAETVYAKIQEEIGKVEYDETSEEASE